MSFQTLTDLKKSYARTLEIDARSWADDFKVTPKNQNYPSSARVTYTIVAGGPRGYRNIHRTITFYCKSRRRTVTFKTLIYLGSIKVTESIALIEEHVNNVDPLLIKQLTN